MYLVSIIYSFQTDSNQLAKYIMSLQSLADMRKSYELKELDEKASNELPHLQFESWLNEAIESKIPEPNAMTLATVGSDLRPSTRVVLVKGLGPEGLIWYTNYESRKGRELAGNPFASLQFHWVELERVVRIEGRVEKISEQESDAYFNSSSIAASSITGTPNSSALVSLLPESIPATT